MTQRDGHDPGDLNFFKEMHMEEGKWVDEKSNLIDAQVKEVLAIEFLHASGEGSQSEAPTSSTNFEDERHAFQKVLRATSKDRRVYGFGARGSVLFPGDSSSSSTAYSQFDEVRLCEQLIANMQRTLENQITERVEQQFQERERKLKEEQEHQRQECEQRMKQMEEKMQTIFRQLSQSSQSEQPNTSTRNSPHSH